VRTIIEMVSMTRLDCVIGSASGMRAALVQAIHHARHRSAFGGPLIGKPAMRNVLADLAVESEAATVLAMRLAGAVDRATRGDEAEQAFRRLAIPVGKFWVCKRQPAVVGEALECLGGNGYVEDSGLPRLYRDAPLNSIWEGSGNVQALDALRAIQRAPGSLDAFFDEVGSEERLDPAVRDLRRQIDDTTELEVRARRIVERMALVLQGSLLIRHAPNAVADAFCASRLAGDWGHTFGTLPAGTDLTAIVERAAP
jgi:putative acyl-CoA dehydrogenase